MRRTSRDLGVELGYLRDNLVDAVRQGKTALVNDALEMYYELVTTFIRKIKAYGSPYDKARAMKELATLDETWSEIEWVEDDLREIYDTCVSTENLHAVREVLYSPIRLASVAYSEGDYYVFHRFLRWVPYYYKTSLKLSDQHLRDFVTERSWLYVRELGELVIMPDVERPGTPAELKLKGEFLVGILLVFNELLKTAFDQREARDFGVFSEKLNGIFEKYDDHVIAQDGFEIERELQIRPLSNERKEKLRLEREVLKESQGLAKEVQQCKKLITYGLGAWVVHEYESGTLDIGLSGLFYKSLRTPSDLSENWSIFVEASKHARQSEFRWDWWEMERRTEGVVWVGGFEQYLQLYFVVLSIQLLREMRPEQRDGAIIPPSPDMLHLAEPGGGPLMQILDKIEGNTEKWRKLIGDEGVGLIPVMRRVLENAVRAQEEKDASAVRKAPLSLTRKEEFKQNILKGWTQEATLRALVGKNRRYRYVDVPQSDKRFFGTNTLDRKDVYMDESRLSFFSWGEEYGRGLARGENEFVLSQIRSELPLMEGQSREQGLQSRAFAAIRRLKESGFLPSVLILNSWFARREIELAERFTHCERSVADPALHGHYAGSPVYLFHVEGPPDVLIVDLKKFGEWIQYRPKQEFEDEEYISKELSLRLVAYETETALQLLKKNPKLALDASGNQRPEEEVIKELLQRVHVRIVEQFEYLVEDKNSGVKISVEREY